MKRSMRWGAAALTFGLSLVGVTAAPPAAAATYDVTDLSDSGANTLRAAITSANGNAGADTIRFQAGISGTVALATVLPTITGDTTIIGSAASRLTLDGADAIDGFVTSGAVNLSIRNLSLSNFRNAVDATSVGSVTLTDVNVTSSGEGATVNVHGALKILGGDLTLSRVRMSSNSGYVGGAVSFLPAAAGDSLTVADSVFTSNIGNGGAGGAIYIAAAASQSNSITRSAFVGNSSASSGAMLLQSNTGFSSTTSISNCTFSANSASNSGGTDGVYAFGDSQVAISFSTFSGHDNTSNSSTGFVVYANSGADLVLTASIIANNPQSAGGTIRECGAGTGGSTFTGSGNYTNDSICPGRVAAPTNVSATLAQLGGFGGTHALNTGSNALGAYTGTSCPPTDQRGIARPALDSDCDVGAYQTFTQPPQKAMLVPATIFVRPGGTSYNWNFTTDSSGGAVLDAGFQNITNPAFNWLLTRGRIEHSGDSGASWTPYVVEDDNISAYQTTASRLWRFIDTSPADTTTSNNVGNCWHLVSAPASTACSGANVIPDNAPTDITANKNTLFDNTAMGATIATLTPTDTGDPLRGYWTLESQSVANLFAISFNRTTGNTATLTRGSGAVPAIGQTPTVTVRYHDVYQTDAIGNPIAGQGFSKTLTFTVVAETSNALTLGNDVLVNTFTTGNQAAPSVALLSTGNVAAVWQSAAQGGGDIAPNSGIYGQLLSSAGAKVGGEFVISNVSSNKDEATPAVTALASGRYAVAYARFGTSDYDIYFRLIDANGIVGGEVLANASTTGNQNYPAIVTTTDGNIVVAWSADNGDVRARKFAASNGAALSTEVLFADGGVAGGYYPSVAALSDGNFALAWVDYTASHVFVRTAPGGVPGTVIDTGIVSSGYAPPRVVGLVGGGFVLASESYDGGTQSQIEAIRYSNAGAVQTARFQVNTVNTGSRYAASIAALTGGGFIVAWGADNGDFDLSGVFGRRYGATAVAVDTTEFQVNQHRLDDQNYPALAPLPGDLFLAAWTDVTGASVAAGTYLGDIEARVLQPPPAPDLTVTKVGNGPFQQGGSASFTVTVTNAGTGPTTAAYTMTDNLPTGLTAGTVTSPDGGWNCSASTSTVVSCTRSTVLAASASTTLTIPVTIAANAAPSITNTANVSGGGETVTNNNSDAETVSVAPVADLAVTKTDGRATVGVGASTTYTITVSNAGPSAAPAALVNDTFPARCSSVTWTCVSAGGGSCVASGGGDIFQSVNLPVGGSVTFSATCAVSGGSSGSLSNTATVSGGSVTDANPGNNSATDTTSITCGPASVSTGSNSGAGSLRQAITDACPGDTISFQPGVTQVNLSGELSIGKDLSIQGGTGVTIDGGMAGRVFNIGGGTTVNLSSLTIQRGTLGSSGIGFAIANGGNLTLTNCTVSGNIGQTAASAAILTSGPLTLLNTTVSNNTSTVSPSGVLISGTPVVVLKNSILSGNSSGDIQGNLDGSSSFSLIGSPSGGLANGVNGNLVGVNPRLSALAANGGTAPTHALLPGSPAINAGTASGAPGADQRGVTRVGNVDMGAFESRGFTLSLASGNNQSTLPSTAFAAPLAVGVAPVAPGEPVNGGLVTFTPPGSGASSTIAGNPASIVAGVATSGTVTANATAGGPYAVAANASGAVSAVNFSLTNIADTTPPTGTVLVADTSLIVGETSLVTFSFSEAVVGFTNADLTVANGTLSAVTSGNGNISFTATLTPTASIEDASNVITVDMAGVTDASANAGSGTTISNNYAIDTRRPATNSVLLSDSALRIGETALVTITFSEAVSNFSNADLSVPNATLSSVSSADGGVSWTATLTPNAATTAASNAILVNQAGLNDLAGNAGSGTFSSGNYAIDTAPPALASTISLSDTALRIGETATVTFTFTEAVLGFTASDVTVENAVLTNPGSADGGVTWTATLTPNAGTTDATNVLALNLAGVSDLAGNPGVGSGVSVNYRIDTQRPEVVSFVIADTSLLAGETSTVTFVFSEPVSGFTIADLITENGATSGLTSGDGGTTWTATLTPSASVNDATNVITVDLTGLSDLNGNAGAGTSTSNNYAVNTVRPTATIAVADTILVAGESSLVTFTFSEAVSGFANDDLTVGNGTLSAVSSADGGITFTATLTPSAGINAPANVITLNNSGYTNAAGNAGSGTTNSNNYAIDTVTRNLTINDVSVTEGNSGTTTLNFTVTVTPVAADGGVGFAIGTQDGSAAAPADYTASSLTGQSIAAGQSTASFAVTVNGESLVESNETVLVNLSSVTGAVVSDGQGVGTINNDDSATVQFAPTSVSQSEATSPMAFTVTLSNPVQSGVTLTVNSAPGSAGAADFTAISSGTLAFAPNSTANQSVNVSLNNDALDEADESFTLTLSGLTATGPVTLGAATATGTIVDDDPAPTISVDSPSRAEGNSGSSVMNFTVSLNAVSGRAVSFTAATADGSATVANNDYVALPPTPFTIAAGSTSVTVPVTIVGDAPYEGNESFSLNITGVGNASPSTLAGTGTILDDDQQPTTTTISSDTPDPTVVGQPYTVSVAVTAQTSSPLGSVTVSDGSASCSAPLVAGTAPASSMSCQLTSTSAGAKTLTANYTPASTAFAASSGSGSHQVNPAATTISVSGPARSRINQPTSFSFALAVTAPGAGTPTGTVTLSSGAASCTATLPATSCSLSFTTLGARTLTASYAGDGNFGSSSSSGAGNAQTLVYALSDLSITKNDGVDNYEPGDLLVYSVVVRNLGPDTAENFRVLDTIPAGLADVVWSCDASGGALCPAAGGAGNLDATVARLPVGGLLNFTFYGNAAGTPAQIANTASIVLPLDTTVDDPTPGNNSASDTDFIEFAFRDGFEDPPVNAPAGSYRLPALALARSLDEEARVVYTLIDAYGEALRVYARLTENGIQYALATRGSDGRLRLAAWATLPGEPTLSWSAQAFAGGWVLASVELR